MSLSPILLRAGGPAFLPHSTVLRAGPLTMRLEHGEVRRILLGEAEILRRIYLAVRGSDWRTIPSVVQDLQIVAGEDSFRAAYSLVHKQDEFDFTWRVEITGDSRGRVSFRAAGRSASAFRTNRVGLCLLHPPRECAGRPVRVVAPDGTEREGRFPETISPHEPFKDIRAFSHQLADGTWADLRFEGEVFEMEDQRNWTDGSFKTYCPPAALPKPRSIEPGWTFDHGVTLEIRPPAPTAEAPAKAAATAGAATSAAAVPSGGTAARVRLTLGDGTGMRLPSLGFSLPSHGRLPGPADARRLRALSPAHLRANFRLEDPDLGATIANARAGAEALGAPLEAALIVGDDVDGSLRSFAALWKAAGGPVSRWLVFHRASDSTPEPVLAAAVGHLRGIGAGAAGSGAVEPGTAQAGAAVAGQAAFALGSKNDFVLLNRGRPALEAEPGASAQLVFAMCPQVHAFDNRNLVESLDGQAWTLRSARALWPGHGLAVSTVSLKRSPFAASLKLSGPPPAGAWLKQADPRQLSLFAAGWTLGSIKRLAEHGAASGTYFETAGPLGLLAGESLAAEERDFPGVDFKLDPAWVFPVYHLFADLADFRGAEVTALSASHPSRCDGLALRAGARRMILLANLEGSPCPVRIEGLDGSARIRRMDEKSARLAVEDAEGYRGKEPEALPALDGAAELVLGPCEWARIDLA